MGLKRLVINLKTHKTDIPLETCVQTVGDNKAEIADLLNAFEALISKPSGTLEVSLSATETVN